MLIHDVIKQMRYLSENCIPFSMEYVSFNQSKGVSKGIVVVNQALLRPNRQSRSTTLVAYTDLYTDQPKFMHFPLITKFNGNLVNNGY